MIKKTKIKAHQEELLKMLKDLELEERFEWVNYRYNKGKRVYSKGDYQKASEIYLDALTGVNFKNQGDV